MTTTRIMLWTGPRNVSTALMYAFAQRPDTRAVDEPYYGHYLRVSGAPHPGAAEVMAAMETDGERVTRQVVLGPCDRPVLFCKNMAHHMAGLSLDFLEYTTNILLTRDPLEMLPSLEKGLGHKPALRDTGYKDQGDILDKLLEFGQTPLVLEARELLRNPASVLEQLCAQIGIPFEPAMLAWPPGPKAEDGVWARHWYDNVHRSTAFQPYRPKTAPFPEHLRPLLAECRPYYERLLPYVIEAKTD